MADDPSDFTGRTDRLTKKQRKGRIAEQFLMDDDAQGFSKKKYESLNDKKRRMGEKKKSLKHSKVRQEKVKR